MRLYLTDCGPRKINVIKVIRQCTGALLQDAKTLSETSNALLWDDKAKPGIVFKRLLEEVGATVEIKGNMWYSSIPRWLRAAADWMER